jgi:REP element-mobilizing transposase RayT
MSPNRPRRLAGFSYLGKHAYLLTICTRNRTRAFADAGFAISAIQQLLQCAEDREFALLAYCLMPDHVHLVPQGRSASADFRSFVLSWSTQLAFAWRRRNTHRLWQGGYYDHVLRPEEGWVGAARYVLMNPVRAGLVERAQDYPFSGSTEYAVEVILDQEGW